MLAAAALLVPSILRLANTTLWDAPTAGKLLLYCCRECVDGNLCRLLCCQTGPHTVQHCRVCTLAGGFQPVVGWSAGVGASDCVSVAGCCLRCCQWERDMHGTGHQAASLLLLAGGLLHSGFAGSFCHPHIGNHGCLLSCYVPSISFPVFFSSFQRMFWPCAQQKLPDPDELQQCMLPAFLPVC